MFRLRLDTTNNTLVLTTDNGDKTYKPVADAAADLYSDLQQLAKTNPSEVVTELEANCQLVLPEPGGVGFQEPDEGGPDADDPDQTDAPSDFDSGHSPKPADVREDGTGALSGSSALSIDDWKTQVGVDSNISQVDVNGTTVYTAMDRSGKQLGTFTQQANGQGVGTINSNGTNGVLESDSEYDTYAGWKRACKKKHPGVWFDGDEDIAQAMVGPRPYKHGETRGVGEWDGDVGTIYSPVVRECEVNDDVILKGGEGGVVVDKNLDGRLQIRFPDGREEWVWPEQLQAPVGETEDDYWMDWGSTVQLLDRVLLQQIRGRRGLPRPVLHPCGIPEMIKSKKQYRESLINTGIRLKRDGESIKVFMDDTMVSSFSLEGKHVRDDLGCPAPDGESTTTPSVVEKIYSGQLDETSEARVTFTVKENFVRMDPAFDGNATLYSNNEGEDGSIGIIVYGQNDDGRHVFQAIDMTEDGEPDLIGDFDSPKEALRPLELMGYRFDQDGIDELIGQFRDDHGNDRQETGQFRTSPEI